MWLGLYVYVENKLTNLNCICAWNITFIAINVIICWSRINFLVIIWRAKPFNIWNWICKTYHNRKATYKHTMKQCIRVEWKLFPWEFPREMHFYFLPVDEKCVFKGNRKSFEYFFMCQIMGNSILIYVELQIFKFAKGIHKILIQNLWFLPFFKNL